VNRPVLLDLFCGAGGAAVGYDRAGFDVVGVDLEPQPDYPFRFVQADAMTYPLDGFDAVHASPPCQGYTTINNRHGSTSPRLIAAVRTRLESTGRPWVIENVVGARRFMRSPVMLHGGMFGLGVYRPRLFESNVLLLAAPPARRPVDAAAVYGKHDRRRLWTRRDGSVLRAASLAEARVAMGIGWAGWRGVTEAIPPAYTEFLGVQLLDHVSTRAA
jgi:DNA (cytosine-5)-methyltransferase 1